MVCEKKLLISVSSVLEAALDLPVGFGLRDGVPLIVELFTAAQPDLDLEAGALEVDLQGNQGIPLLGHQALELHDLLLMHKEAAIPQGLAVEDIAVLVGADVNADGVELTVYHLAVGVLEVDPATADALDLGAVELDPGLVFFVDEVVMPGFFILGDHLNARLGRLFGHGEPPFLLIHQVLAKRSNLGLSVGLKRRS